MKIEHWSTSVGSGAPLGCRTEEEEAKTTKKDSGRQENGGWWLSILRNVQESNIAAGRWERVEEWKGCQLWNVCTATVEFKAV